ncbi:DUF4349 domain-containing protein [Flavivirga amylovorans]|uniref:DUF4349 domain-containing protein n=1 Tax=Flavivirga amylovorans TaxID=870486 RepID=A0ABT8WYU1_9FLAO|nr:DUF4349 domain-containing protein [Flavivirga amylovorans]MDO5986633.1 DUF4349 domain-containing protein [Flavivirga amylovorans]
MKANQLKTVLKILAVNLILVSFFACNQSSKYKESVPVSNVEINEDFESVNDDDYDFVLKQDASTNAIPKHLKIIKSANAKYKVKDVKKATNQIKRMAYKYGAYISDLRFDNNLYKKENRFTLKVPEQYFDSMMDSIGSFVEFIDYENITTQDVTEEYIDIETRLKTKLEVKQRYESILRKNAITVEDILATEDKLRVIQEEIEVAQGRLKYLTNKVSYSTIQIDLYETVVYKEEPTAYNKTFWSKSKEGISFGWDFIESIVIGMIHIWPLIIIGVLIFFLIKKRLKRKS